MGDMFTKCTLVKLLYSLATCYITYEMHAYSLSLRQGWNWVSITDLDDPLTRIVIQVRPIFDPDVIQMWPGSIKVEASIEPTFWVWLIGSVLAIAMISCLQEQKVK